MVSTQSLAPIKAQVSKLEKMALDVPVTTDEEYARAVDIVAKFKETGSLIKQKKESITKPLNDALKNARALFLPLEQQFANAETVIKDKLLAYKRKKDAEARKKEAQIAARVERGTMKIETATDRMKAIKPMENTVRGTVGQAQFRKIKKVRLVNRSLVPEQYWVLDMVAVRRDALSGKEVPGFEVYEEETLAATRI